MAEECEHKPAIGCVLTATPRCCSCADRRALAPAYPVYIDGAGMKLQGRRWHRYCWRCRDYWNLQSLSNPDLLSHINPQPPSGPSPTRHPPSETMNSTIDYPRSRDNHLTPFRRAPSCPIEAPARSDASNRRMSFQLSPSQNINTHPNPLWQQPLSGGVRMAMGEHTPEDVPDSDISSQSQPLNSNPPEAPRPRRQRPILNPFGTREEVEADDYQSPVADLFGRAWARHQNVQLANQTRVAHEEEIQAEGDVGILGTAPPQQEGIDLQTAMALDHNRSADRLDAMEDTLRERDNLATPPPVNPIDQQPSRPPPLGSEEMIVSVACKICCEQKVDTLLEPCMHVAICRWCSELVRRRHQDAHRAGDPTTRWRCPICRRGILQTRRIFLA